MGDNKPFEKERLLPMETDKSQIENSLFYVCRCGKALGCRQDFKQRMLL